LIEFVGCFLVLGANKQALHDIIAKTAVYKKADIASSTTGLFILIDQSSLWSIFLYVKHNNWAC
jgi:hypothetical protein